MQARRGGAPAPQAKPGRPQRKVKFSYDEGLTPRPPDTSDDLQIDINFDVDLGENDEADFLKALESPTDRLKYMMRRHKRTLSGFDQEHYILNQLLNTVGRQGGGTMADIKFFIQRRHELLGKRADYDLKMSKELQVWRELAAQEVNETPIDLILVDLPPREWVTVPAVGDTMDFTDYMPQKAGETPKVPGNG